MEMIFGAHISSSGGFLKMAKKAESLGFSSYQFFVRNPRGGKAKELNETDLAAFQAHLENRGISGVLVHAPYTMNVCSPNPETRAFGMRMMQEDLALMAYFPGHYYNFHPGCAVGQPEDTAIGLIADALDCALQDIAHTTVLLETMAGKGSEIGGSFQQIRNIIDRTQFSDRIGVCLDTCHIWDAGYDLVSSPEGVLEEFDRIIGLERLKAIHLNDSKNPCASRKDRHACLGDGMIGIRALSDFIRQPALRGLPVILETPTDDQGHAEEVCRLKTLFL